METDLVDARRGLATLATRKPDNLKAVLEKLSPEIEAALETGHSYRMIAEILAKSGVEVKEKTLAVYVSQFRKGPRKKGPKQNEMDYSLSLTKTTIRLLIEQGVLTHQQIETLILGLVAEQKLSADQEAELFGYLRDAITVERRGARS